MGEPGSRQPNAGDRATSDKAILGRSTIDRGHLPWTTSAGATPELITDGPVAKSPARFPPGLAGEPPLRPLPRWSGLYVYPVAQPHRRPADTWGNTRKGGRPHHGVDVMAASGTRLYAITDGFVSLVAHWRGAGLTVRLLADDGRTYEYMHLRAVSPTLRVLTNPPDVVPGKVWTQRRLASSKPGAPHRPPIYVTAGTEIGEVGNTGAPGVAPHLHLQAFPDHTPRLDLGKGVDERWNPIGLLERIRHAGGRLKVGVVTYGKQGGSASTPAPAAPAPLEGSVGTGWIRRGRGRP